MRDQTERERIVLNLSDPDNPEDFTSCTLAEFLRDNNDPEVADLCRQVEQLEPGASVMSGGGAQPVVEIRRAAWMGSDGVPVVHEDPENGWPGELCPRCGEPGAEERYSLGIYAGVYCGRCWKASGYRDEPASAFDPADAGEAYDPEPEVGS